MPGCRRLALPVASCWPRNLNGTWRWTLNEAGRYLRASDLVTVNVERSCLWRRREFARRQDNTNRNYFYMRAIRAGVAFSRVELEI